MIKEFQIKDILNAVNSISKIEKNQAKINNAKSLTNKCEIVRSNKQAKSKKSVVLVLNQMIE